jgi:hypothetical protein
MSLVDTPQGFSRFYDEISKDLSLALKGSLQLLFYICSKTNIEFDIGKKRSAGALSDGSPSSQIDVDDFAEFVELLAGDGMRDLSRVTKYWDTYRGASGRIEVSRLLAKLRDFSEKDHEFAIYMASNVMPMDYFSRLLGMFSEIQALSGFIRQIRNRHAHPYFIDEKVGGQMYRLHILTSCGYLLEAYKDAFSICSLVEEPNGEADKPSSPQWAKAKALFGNIRNLDSTLAYIEREVLSIGTSGSSGDFDSSETIDGDTNEAAMPEISRLISESSREILDSSALLHEQIESSIKEMALELKSSLLKPWQGMDLETLINKLSSNTPPSVPLAQPEANSPQRAKESSEEMDTSASQEKIVANLLELRRTIRDELHSIDPTFEYYHCILMKPVVVAAVRAGARTYQEFRMNPEFKQRILDKERKMLAHQEAYADQIRDS